MQNRLPLERALACVLLTLLASCATTSRQSEPVPRTHLTPHTMASSITQESADTARSPIASSPVVHKGTGVVVKGQQPGGGVPVTPPVAATGSGVVLNFEGADLREVVRNILGDILNESYTISAQVGGQVTIRTSSGVPREALPATLETLLRMNGATMVKENGIYKIVPQAEAVRGNITPQLGSTQRALPPGYSVQIVPLRFVGVREMVRLLEPFAKEPQTSVRADELRNLLVLSGTERELRHLLDAIDMFDIDWMAGMSAGVFVLQNSDVKTVMQEIEKILGTPQANPLGGILRIVPIERMNALLVISPQAAYLEKAKEWIARLDQGGQGEGLRFYVFNLQNQRAEKIAPLLQQAFTGRPAAAAAPSAPTLAPGTPAGQIVSPPAFQPQQPLQPTPPPAVTPPPAQTAATAAAATAAAIAARGGAGGDGLGVVRNIQVVADKDNNTILIVATQAEFSIIEAALKKLDMPSRQVLIDLTIAEVGLTDNFSFGVQWYFSNGPKQAGGLFTGLDAAPGNVFNPASTGGFGAGRGFNWLLAGAFPGGVQAALNFLSTYGNSKTIASPQIAALDNQKATIKVGDRIPISQQTLVGGVSDAVTTTSSYIDTGVLVSLTPHINAGGLVTLDVSAEFSTLPTDFDASSGSSPPINTRSVQTMLNVQSGQTMMMGGLIREDKGQADEGLPWLHQIPVIGGLFGTQSRIAKRTELVLFLTPRVMENEIDMKNALGDLRKRMYLLDDVFAPVQKPPETR